MVINLGMYGIDVSKWNTKTCVEKAIRKYDCKFIIIKVTEGRTYKDPNAGEFVNLAQRTGLHIGFYHYARPDNGNTAKEEIANFISTVNELCDKFKINEWFPVIDWEGDSIGKERPWLSHFCQDFIAMTEKPVCIYTNQFGTSKIDRTMAGVENCGLWIATRGKGLSDIPSTQWNVTAMHQFKVDPELNIDINYFFGSDNQFSAYCVKYKRSTQGCICCGSNSCGCKCTFND